jgi:hypothetical protein
VTTRTDAPAARPAIQIQPSQVRTTPPPAERRFRAVLEDGAGVLLRGVESATRALPGGAVVTAAVRGVAGTVGGDAGDLGAGGAARSLEQALGSQADSQMQYLELQQRIQDENRRYTTLSNVLKARHETAKTAIGNIR